MNTPLASRSALIAIFDLELARMVELALQSLGARTEICRCPRKTLQRAMGREFDLLVLDEELPSNDPVDTIHQLRAFEACRDLPLVLLSHGHVTTELLAALRAGQDQLLRVPFGLQSLQATVEFLAVEREEMPVV